MEIDVHGGSSQALTGEIGLSEFQNVFAEVFICPETMELLQESLRETHFEATAASFSNILENQQGIKSETVRPRCCPNPLTWAAAPIR